MSIKDPTASERNQRLRENRQRKGFKRVEQWIVDNPVAIQKVKDYIEKINEEFFTQSKQ